MTLRLRIKAKQRRREEAGSGGEGHGVLPPRGRDDVGPLQRRLPGEGAAGAGGQLGAVLPRGRAQRDGGAEATATGEALVR